MTQISKLICSGGEGSGGGVGHSMIIWGFTKIGDP